MKLKLTIELVPKSCWFSNVRSSVTKKQWDAIKSTVSTKAYNVCEICGGVGPKHPVECHEIWNYNDKKFIQKLIGMVALCPDCHMVKHMGLARVQGREVKATKHFMKVNSLSYQEANDIIDEAFVVWLERSNKTWILDITHLEEYGIDSKNIRKIL